MKFMPILAKGEKLAQEIIKGRSGGEKKKPYTYEQARDRAIRDIQNVENEISINKELYIENEIILNIRMAEDFIAKSYTPVLFSKKEEMEFLGARIYNKKEVKNKQVKSKLYFVRCSKNHLNNFLEDLKADNFTETEIKQLRAIETIDIMDAEEKTLGFNEVNEVYQVEIVLHPLKSEIDKAVSKIEKYFIGEANIKKYGDGPTFILAKIKQGDLVNIARYNFLRTVHPMRDINLPQLKSFNGMGLPKLPIDKKLKRIVKIGVFDGGVNASNPYLKSYVKNHELSSLKPDVKSVEHGNAVCGAILYGEINAYKNNEHLKSPICSVESFRVLPEKDLYKVIDNIEETVKNRTDIDIYNISFGPRGPILDDQINRFTYSLDKLALLDKVFCIAVGNDGKVKKPFNRIQAPSDSVNNIGVGAYSSYNNKIYRAEYSCIGTGREGGKVKPDILAFGGDERNMFQAISLDGSVRMLTAGTSFASPIVAGKIGELNQVSKQMSILVSRTMLIHSAQNLIKNGDEEGFGIAVDDVKSILGCSTNKVTILYEGFITPTKSMKLPIPLPNLDNEKGTMKFNWTTCVVSDVNMLDSDIYTNTCVEDTFHPNSDIFLFTKKGEKKTYKLNINEDTEDIEKLKLKGYKQSKNPVSDSPNYRSELERRIDFKWDTISRKTKGKKIEGLKDPFLILTATSRDENDLNKVKFCVALTIEMNKYLGNMYEDILNRYEVLEPIEVEQEIEEELEYEV